MGLISDFEERLGGAIEGAFSGMFKSPVQPAELARACSKEMTRSKKLGISKIYVANVYSILLSTHDREALAGLIPTLQGELETYLLAFAREHDFQMATRPVVRFYPDPTLKLGRFEAIGDLLSVDEIQEELGYVPGVTPEPAPEPEPEPAPAPVAAEVEPYAPDTDEPIAAAPGFMGADPEPIAAAPGFEDLDFDLDDLDEPGPAPIPEPVPEPSHTVTRVPRQPQAPTPAPEPAPAFSPEPAPAPRPRPAAAPEFEPEPAPAPAPRPRPQAQPQPTAPRPRPQAADAVAPSLSPVQASLTVEGFGTLSLQGKRSVTIGRQDDNDLVLADVNASRHHARLERDGNGWALVDLGATNGTHLNGRRMTRNRLRDGDVMTIGVSRITYHEKAARR